MHTYIENPCLYTDCGKGTCVYLERKNKTICSNMNQWMHLNKKKLANKTLSQIAMPGYL